MGYRPYVAIRYRHTQVGWLTIVIVVLVGLVALPPIVSAGLTWAALPLVVVLGFVLLGFAAMTVIVDERGIEARMGVGVIRKRVAWSELLAYRQVKNPWYYGWGIRFYPGGTLYNVSGALAVELALQNGKRLRFGSDEPVALLAAIERVFGKSQPIPLAHEQAVRSRAKRTIIVSLAASVLIVGGLAVLFYVEMRPPQVRVTDGTFSVRSGVYGAKMPLSSISSLTLEDRLPRILLRTNGFALGGTLRGHFRLDGVKDGELFIQAGLPPYVVVRSTDEYVAVNFTEPERTRELYALLKRESGAR